MKRTAAILGPTPPFLRWAIALPCPLRDLETKASLPDATFRQLRSLRALSVGELEGRVKEGFCLHHDTINGDSRLGFPVDEVLQAYGGEAPVRSACDACPANVPLDGAAKVGLAGCFGWLAFPDDQSDGTGEFMRLMRCQSDAAMEVPLVEAFQRATDSMPFELSPNFAATTPRWFGVWGNGKLDGRDLKLLESCCAKVHSNQTGWLRFVAAIRACAEGSLTLVTDLVPRGCSDGTWWTLEPACAKCSVTRDRSVAVCPCCGTTAKPLHERKLKVLGLRPYLDLRHVVGDEGLQRLRDKP